MVREKRHGATVGISAGSEGRRWNEQSGHQAGGDQEDAHDDGCCGEQLAGVAYPILHRRTRNQRHHSHAGFKTWKAER